MNKKKEHHLANAIISGILATGLGILLYLCHYTHIFY